MGCCNGSKNFGTMFFCIPLALFAIVSGILFILWGSWEINAAVNDAKFPSWTLVLAIILSALKILLGTLGLFGTLFRWAPGVSALISAYKILLVSIVISFILTWVQWIIKIVQSSNKGENFTHTQQILYMATYTVVHIIFFVASWWIISCYKSLAEVLKVGGHGWECQNWRAVKEEKSQGDKAAKAALKGHDDDLA